MNQEFKNLDKIHKIGILIDDYYLSKFEKENLELLKNSGLNIELYFNGTSKIRSLFLISIFFNSLTLNNGIFIFNFKNCSSIRE